MHGEREDHGGAHERGGPAPLVRHAAEQQAAVKGAAYSVDTEGLFAMAIGFPTVPQGKARIRVMNSAAHSAQDLEIALDTFAQVGQEMGII